MQKLPLSSMEKLLKKSGAIRVSESAKKELLINLIRKIENITPKAQDFAEHSNRKTIKKQDIKITLDF